MSVIDTKDYTTEYQDDQEAKEKLYAKMLAFFKEHEAFSGESVAQNDGPQIASTELLSNKAIIFRAKVLTTYINVLCYRHNH